MSYYPKPDSYSRIKKNRFGKQASIDLNLLRRLKIVVGHNLNLKKSRPNGCIQNINCSS